MIKVTRRATREEGAFCSACNRLERHELVRLVVKRKGYDEHATWLCRACLRHIDKARATLTKGVAHK